MRRSAIVAFAGLLLLPVAARAGDWYDRVKVSGDLRHRHESIRDESQDEDRTRWRIRARVMLSARLDENLSVGVRIASGSDDPLSTNQTLDGGWSSKSINLDLAYFDFHPEGARGLHLIGGKMKLPFRKVGKTELLWDGDLNPEGLAATFEGDINDRVGVMFGGGFFYVEENSDSDDLWMAGGQGVIRIEPRKDMHILAGAGYYDYNIDDRRTPVFFDDEDSFGNSTVPGDGDQLLYANDFNQFEVLAELAMKIDEVGLSIYGNFVDNLAADSLGSGYLLGASAKRGKGRGNVKMAVSYREVEDDAVIGAFTDSDFSGGGTDGSGWELGFGYGLADRADLGINVFINDKGIDEEVDYKRFMIDLMLKF